MSLLSDDLTSHPNLRLISDTDVGELEKQLRGLHKYLMGGDSLLIGYLYQKQVAQVRTLKQQLEELNHD